MAKGKTEGKSFVTQHKKIWKALDGLITDNPVFVQGLALTPMIVAASTLQNGLLLSLAFTALYLPSTAVAGVLGGYFPRHLRSFVFALTAALFYIPTYFLVSLIDPNITQTMGVYLPLLVVDALLLQRTQTISNSRAPLFKILLQGVVTMVQFCLAALLLGALRELLSYGTLLGVTIFQNLRVPIMTKAFTGFLLVGLFAAWSQFLSARLKRAAGLREKELQNEPTA